MSTTSTEIPEQAAVATDAVTEHLVRLVVADRHDGALGHAGDRALSTIAPRDRASDVAQA